VVTTVLSIKTPDGFTVNANVSGTGAPLSFNNFGDQYFQGGNAPEGGAEIDVTEIPLPPPPLGNFVDVEIHDAGLTVDSRATAMVNGVSCIQANSSSDDGGRRKKTEAVYCPSGLKLYKFYLSYYSGDAKGPQYLTSFGGMLNGVVFP
jgi:hypothetical protein